MSDIRVIPMHERDGVHEFGVQVHEADEHTDHHVLVGERFLEDLGLVDPDLKDLVFESFAFLLEREKPFEIPEEVSLADLQQEYEDYLPEMRDRLGG